MTGGDDFDELGEDFLAILAIKGEGELGIEQAEADADVEAASAGFVGEIAFAAGQFSQGGGELNFFARFGVGHFMIEQIEHRGSEDMHAEEAEIMSGAQPRDDQLLFGIGGGGFFEDFIDQIKERAAGDAFAADGAVVREHIFAGGLDGGDGAGFGAGDFHELLGAAPFFLAEVEVIADEVEERFTRGKRPGAEEGVSVAERGGLFDELEFALPIAGGGGIAALVAGADDEANLVDAGAAGFFENDAQGRFGGAIAIDQGLDGKFMLVRASGGDDGFFYSHSSRVVWQRNQGKHIWKLQRLNFFCSTVFGGKAVIQRIALSFSTAVEDRTRLAAWRHLNTEDHEPGQEDQYCDCGAGFWG